MRTSNRKPSGKIDADAELTRRLKKLLQNITSRCCNPNAKAFNRYGGRGIENVLTLDDLRILWERDSAGSLARPSIDRRDVDGHYAFENCRFIEAIENRLLADRRHQCTVCNIKTVGIRRGLCPNCQPAPRCIRCDGPRDSSKHVCDACRFQVRPCAWCGQLITRDTATPGYGISPDTQSWFCNRQEKGSWFGSQNKGKAKTKRIGAQA